MSAIASIWRLRVKFQGSGVGLVDCWKLITCSVIKQVSLQNQNMDVEIDWDPLLFESSTSSSNSDSDDDFIDEKPIVAMGLMMMA